MAFAESNLSSNPLTRCPGLWFSDGTVVLQAETTLFCVYSGLLEQASPVFRDLFQLPQSSAQEMYEGRPFIQMPDPARDLQDFLKCFHTYSYMADLKTPFDIETLLRIMRLSWKYQADDIGVRCLAMLSHWFPCSVGALDAMQAEQAEIPKELVLESRRYFAWSIMAANVFRETQNLHLLPFALLRVCEFYLVEEIIDGIDLEDGLGLQSLDSVDKRAVLIAKNTLAQHAKKKTFPILFTPAVDTPCSGEEICLGQRAELARPIESDEGFVCPVRYFRPAVWEFTKDTLCSHCYSHLVKSYKTGRQEIMDCLPEMFGLPPWDELIPQVSKSSS